MMEGVEGHWHRKRCHMRHHWLRLHLRRCGWQVSRRGRLLFRHCRNATPKLDIPCLMHTRRRPHLWRPHLKASNSSRQGHMRLRQLPRVHQESGTPAVSPRAERQQRRRWHHLNFCLMPRRRCSCCHVLALRRRAPQLGCPQRQVAVRRAPTEAASAAAAELVRAQTHVMTRSRLRQPLGLQQAGGCAAWVEAQSARGQGRSVCGP